MSMMERRCSCCTHHSYGRHNMYNDNMGEGVDMQRQPLPAWPLVLLGLVIALLMGPQMLEPPEEVSSQVGACLMLLPFVLLLAFYMLNSQPQHHPYEYPQHHYSTLSYAPPSHASHSSTYSSSPPPPSPSEEPLYGWGLFLLFILAIILVPLTHS